VGQSFWVKFMYFCASMLEIIAGCTIFMFVVSLLLLIFAGR
jgi:hypothetical protein